MDEVHKETTARDSEDRYKRLRTDVTITEWSITVVPGPSASVKSLLRCKAVCKECGYGDPKYYSFGYDESTDDYKIVEMCTTVEILDLYASTETIEEVNIYSLKTGKWKNLGDFSYRDPLIGSGIFSNGALHWVAYDLLDSSYTQRIVSLDLAKETYGEVLQPEYDEGDTDLALGVLGEWLCVLCTYPHYRNHVPDVWVMKVYGVKDSWTKLASIQDPAHYWTSQRSVPLCISNDGKMLFQFSNRFVIYDSKDNYVSHIQDFLFSQACIVVESLVSPFPPLCLADNNDDENLGKR
ncbi:F-box associated interaction domain-containing protein [Artemisia annua]|uniref:F-box associated interaction domain-containing protein n=1 Tax=Artemisia annua TaxID=35608 RepID=A0A2U1PSX7_ARTAN|nr:F-box associated interaction domain-containing protein [Artemisia annua]